MNIRKRKHSFNIIFQVNSKYVKVLINYRTRIYALSYFLPLLLSNGCVCNTATSAMWFSEVLHEVRSASPYLYIISKDKKGTVS